MNRERITSELLAEMAAYPSFPNSAADLVRVLGIDDAAALVSLWGGGVYLVPAVVGGGCAAGQRSWRRLVSAVGADAAKRLVFEWGGCRIQIPNLKTVKDRWQRDITRRDYEYLIANGASSSDSVFELALHYGVTQKAVESTIGKPFEHPRYEAGGGALSVETAPPYLRDALARIWSYRGKEGGLLEAADNPAPSQAAQNSQNA